MDHAEDSFNEQLAGKKYAISKSLDHLHEFDKSEGDMNIGTRKRDTQFAKLPQRQPNSTVRRQLFPSPPNQMGISEVITTLGIT